MLKQILDGATKVEVDFFVLIARETRASVFQAILKNDFAQAVVGHDDFGVTQPSATAVVSDRHTDLSNDRGKAVNSVPAYVEVLLDCESFIFVVDFRLPVRPRRRGPVRNGRGQGAPAAGGRGPIFRGLGGLQSPGTSRVRRLMSTRTAMMKGMPDSEPAVSSGFLPLAAPTRP